MARAIRTGDDRSDGMRNTRDCLADGIGPRNCGRGHHGSDCGGHRSGRAGCRAGWLDFPNQLPPGVRRALQRQTHGPRLYGHLPSPDYTPGGLRRQGGRAYGLTESPLVMQDEKRLDVIELGDEFYIRAQSSLADDRTRVLLDGGTFAIFDRYGDIQPVGFGQQGIFDQDTRYLSRLELRL